VVYCEQAIYRLARETPRTMANAKKRPRLRVGVADFDYPVALTPAVARLMRANRSRDTRPELTVRKLLRRLGFPGYRLQWPIVGRPDIAFPGRRVAIFVHGCFWHACERCARSRPKNNAAFWTAKFALTKTRDRLAKSRLEAADWLVIIVRECELENAKTLRQTARRLSNALFQRRNQP
jgi:DNA mismatch endonuclease (patch repair protein)